MSNSPETIAAETPPSKITRDSELIDFMLHYAKHYMASGGPTSRLEESLVQIGNKNNKHTEIFATPTGVFVTIQDMDHSFDPKTSLLRIKEMSTDLGKLCELEKLFNQVMNDEISIHMGLMGLRNFSQLKQTYNNWQLCLAAFVAGFAISFGSYQRLTSALVSGLITSFIWLLSNLVMKRYLKNPIFSDFMGAFFTLTLAAIAHGLIMPLSIESYALGGMVLLVPGLSLTTSISELAEQNLVSGTAKFMQSILTLLALGLAYLLFQEIAESLHLRNVLQPVASKTQVEWVSGLAIIVNIICYSIIFKVPARILGWSTLTGVCGWLCITALTDTTIASAAPYLASVAVGLVSLSLGRIHNQPSQVFSVPGIVGMLPGMLAFSSFRYFVSGDGDSGMAFSVQVAITAVSIVFGLMTARIPFALRASLRN